MHDFQLKMHHKASGGWAPPEAAGSTQRSLDSLAGFRGGLRRGNEGRGAEEKGTYTPTFENRLPSLGEIDGQKELVICDDHR